MLSKTKAAAQPESIPVVLVTSEMAQEWLDTRFDNERNLREKTRVDAMVRDMVTGNWYFTGDPIRFDRDTGRLIDGQHRLSAIVKSDTAQYMAVVNLPLEARKVIDTGAARSLGDLLNFGGHIKGRTTAAVVRRVLTYQNGTRGTEGGAYYPTASEGMDFVTKHHDGLVDAVNMAQNVYHGGRQLPMAPAIIGATYFLCAEKDKEQADDFFTKLIFGLDLHDGDPVLALRNRALRTRETQGRPMTPDDAFRFIIMAWNLTREGIKVRRLNTPKGGWRQNNVPTVQ